MQNPVNTATICESVFTVVFWDFCIKLYFCQCLINMGVEITISGILPCSIAHAVHHIALLLKALTSSARIQGLWKWVSFVNLDYFSALNFFKHQKYFYPLGFSQGLLKKKQ